MVAVLETEDLGKISVNKEGGKGKDLLRTKYADWFPNLPLEVDSDSAARVEAVLIDESVFPFPGTPELEATLDAIEYDCRWHVVLVGTSQTDGVHDPTTSLTETIGRTGILPERSLYFGPESMMEAAAELGMGPNRTDTPADMHIMLQALCQWGA